MFCNLLKSKIKVEEKIMSGRNKSQIKRRKKYNKLKSSNNLSCIKKFTYFNNKKKNNINDSIIDFNYDDEKILILHKMSKTKDNKKSIKKNLQKNILTANKENHLYVSKCQKRIYDTTFF